MEKVLATAEGLANVLLDRNETLSSRDDAAMALSEFDEPIALESLIKVARDEGEDEMLHSSAGESIGQIWVRLARFDEAVFESLTLLARMELAGAMGLKEKLADKLRA